LRKTLGSREKESRTSEKVEKDIAKKGKAKKKTHPPPKTHQQKIQSSHDVANPPENYEISSRGKNTSQKGGCSKVGDRAKKTQGCDKTQTRMKTKIQHERNVKSRT